MLYFYCEQCEGVNCVPNDQEGQELVCKHCLNTVTIPFYGDPSCLTAEDVLVRSGHHGFFFHRWLQKAMEVRYDELTVFVMSGSLLLLVCLSSVLRQDINRMIQSFIDKFVTDVEHPVISVLLFGGIIGALIVIPFLWGMIISIYHVFSYNEKGKYTKFSMFVFALLITVISGVASGFHLLVQAISIKNVWYLTFFPILNFINAFWLILRVCVKYDPEGMAEDITEAIDDRDATLIEVAVASVVVAVVVILGQYAFKLHWSLIYSMCVVYAINFCKSFKSVFSNAKIDDTV